MGGAVDSAPVNVTVGQARVEALSLSPRRVSRTQVIRPTVTAPAGDYVIQQSTDLKTWVDIYPVTVGASGSAVQDDSGGPANNRNLFYRVKKP
ncbi:MAG: hypothetical protein U1G07_10310 [Verrucomicrobiota bacterium]